MKKLFILLLCFAAITTISRAEEAPARPVENRFLFVFETSWMADRSSKAAHQTVQELIESGVQGQMLPGDSFGLWTFNNGLDTKFPMQEWIPSESKKLAAAATEYLKKRRFENKTNLKSVLPPLFSVVKSSKAITVILISTGNNPIQGTPFDAEINSIYSSHSRELRDAKLPFVTILVGRNGRIVAHAVNSALGPFRIPAPPMPLEHVVAKANPPVVTNEVIAVAKETVAPRKIAKSNIIISKATIAAATTDVAVAAIAANEVAKIATEDTNQNTVAVSSLTPKSSRTNPPALAGKINTQTNLGFATAIPATQANSAKTNKINPPSVVSETAVVKTTAENSPSSEAENARSKDVSADDDPTAFKPRALEVVDGNLPQPKFTPRPDENRNTVPTELATQPLVEETNLPPLNPTPVIATQPPGKSTKFFAIGAALFVVAGVLIYFVVRSSRGKSQPSIISRSLDNRK